MIGTRLAVSLAVGLVAVVGAPGARALAPVAPLTNGVYQLNFEGAGRPVQLTDGSEGVLGKKLTASVGATASLTSVSNDNSTFYVTFKKVGPLPAEATEVQTALVVDGVCLHLSRPDKLPPGGIVNLGAYVYSAESARTLAAHYKVEPQRRKHPGHRFQVRWAPDKASYAPGEKVVLKLELENTGTTPLRFTFGGKQRGPRNNQFRFLAYRSYGGGKAVPDTGDPTNFGGISVSKTLKPGEVFRASVELDRWFHFTEPDVYKVTGILELPVYDPESEDPFARVLWDDLAVGDCLVRVVRKEK